MTMYPCTATYLILSIIKLFQLLFLCCQGRRLGAGYWPRHEPPTNIKIQEGNGSSKPNIPGEFSLPITLSLAVQNKLVFYIYTLDTCLIPRPFHPSICCLVMLVLQATDIVACTYNSFQ